MKKLLIIYPHWYPSNLAGVHRARLIGNFLNLYNWQPIILTVKPEFYEEAPDPDIYKLFTSNFLEYRVSAKKIKKTRLIGDIGLRAFLQLYKKAIEIISTEKPDFLWIPIPSFYTAILGRLLNNRTKILYGIDYIDPWVRDISKDGSLRAKLSLLIAKILEPVAVKKASLITGVAFEYFKPVLDRNFKRKNLFSNFLNSNQNKTKSAEIINTYENIIYSVFPYGFDSNDHKIKISNLILPWHEILNCKPIVFAGAFMPNSQIFLMTLFKAIKLLINDNKIPNNLIFYFIGTGNYNHKSIREYAKDFGISRYIIEINNRLPYLNILNILSNANRLLILGSTEKHYTASKTYQVILSKKPIFSMLHFESSAIKVLRDTETDKFLVLYNPNDNIETFEIKTFNTLNLFLNNNIFWNPNYLAINQYSASNSAFLLTQAIESIIENKIN